MTLQERIDLYESKHQASKLVLDESLFEDEVKPVDTTPEDNGVQNMLQFLIKDEWDAIEGYNNTIQTLKDLGGYDELCSMLQEISNEELVHVGQLQKGIESVNPDASKIKEGEEEASVQMNEANSEVENEETV